MPDLPDNTLWIDKPCDCDPPWPACKHMVRTFPHIATTLEVLERVGLTTKCDTCKGLGGNENDWCVAHKQMEQPYAEKRTCRFGLCEVCSGRGWTIPDNLIDIGGAAIGATYPNGPETDWNPEAEVVLVAVVEALTERTE